MWDAVSHGLQPQPWHHNVIWAPPYHNTSTFYPHLHRYNSVRMHPYAHPQHMKLLKHVIYIQYGCGMQSAVVYSLNHNTTMSFGLSLTPIFRREICQKTVTEWFRLSVDLTHDCSYPPTSPGKCFFVSLTEKVSDDVTLKAPGDELLRLLVVTSLFWDMYPVILISVNLTNYILLCLLTSQRNCCSLTSL